MKSPKPANRKKGTLKLQDLKTKKEPRGGVKPNRPNRDGLWTNHNEMFLADAS
jgi:hypothetical protein